jgi:YegS/Rv2252/BmrU family lipid kinase
VFLKYLFIVNPYAGKGKSNKAIPHIKRVFTNDDYFKIVKTEYSHHAEELAKEAVSNGFDIVFSVGGDGTLNEVANGIAGSNVKLGLIPCGAGNDFIKSIDTAYNKSIALNELVKRQISSKTRSVDIGTVNDKYFLNIASAGFDAAVVINREKFKRFPILAGRLSYYISVFYTLIKCKKYDFEIIIDNKLRLKDKYLLVTVSNGKYYGGGMTPTPDAEIDDGFLDLCLIKSMTRINIMKFFPKFIKGKHTEVKEVSFERCKHIEIKCKHIFPLNIDGETSISNHAIFDIKKKAIEVIISDDL